MMPRFWGVTLVAILTAAGLCAGEKAARFAPIKAFTWKETKREVLWQNGKNWTLAKAAIPAASFAPAQEEAGAATDQRQRLMWDAGNPKLYELRRRDVPVTDWTGFDAVMITLSCSKPWF